MSPRKSWRVVRLYGVIDHQWFLIKACWWSQPWPLLTNIFLPANLTEAHSIPTTIQRCLVSVQRWVRLSDCGGNCIYMGWWHGWHLPASSSGDDDHLLWGPSWLCLQKVPPLFALPGNIHADVSVVLASQVDVLDGVGRTKSDIAEEG